MILLNHFYPSRVITVTCSVSFPTPQFRQSEKMLSCIFANSEVKEPSELVHSATQVLLRSRLASMFCSVALTVLASLSGCWQEDRVVLALDPDKALSRDRKELFWVFFSGRRNLPRSPMTFSFHIARMGSLAHSETNLCWGGGNHHNCLRPTSTY